MNKLDVLNILSKYTAGKQVISSLGDTSFIWKNIQKDNSHNFYMLGSMGLPISFGIGLSLINNSEVFVIEGDGGTLMNLGVLTTLGFYPNLPLKIIILDNESYETTGGQQSKTYFSSNLELIARGCGINNVVTIGSKELLTSMLSSLEENKQQMLIIKIQNMTETIQYPNMLTPPHIKKAFLKKNI